MISWSKQKEAVNTSSMSSMALATHVKCLRESNEFNECLFFTQHKVRNNKLECIDAL
jgi:hypothetical protein